MNFNPRAPYGARHNDQVTKVINRLFQSTRPIRGATSKGISIAFDFNRFQSTRPIRGATWGHRIDISIIWDFNPRAPYGARHVFGKLSFILILFQSTRPIRGATADILSYLDQIIISIHAPHTGRDCFALVIRLIKGISIHAPHTGRDAVLLYRITQFNLFQSTRPIRGATAKMHNLCSAFLQ